MCWILIPPVLSVTSIKYLDTAGVQQTLDSSLYLVDTVACCVVPAYGQSWPSLYPVSQPVTVRISCGYGATAASVPGTIKSAMLLLIAHWYENREAAQGSSMAVTSIPIGVDALLAPYRWDMI